MLDLVSIHITKQPHRGVMVSAHTSSAVDRGFEHRSDQTEDYNIGICCFSTEHTTLSK